MYKICNVIKKYSDNRNEQVMALDEICLELPEKGLVVICGPSGCGKTTLLNILGGLDRPTSGEVYIGSERIDDKDEEWWDKFRSSRLGFVYQDFNLLENMTVYDNIALPINLQNVKENFRRSVIKEISNELGLNELLDKNSGKLSGGQKQRVAIARALATDAKIILADEPTGNLDRNNSETVFKLLKKIASNRLVVVVTHDNVLANTYADRLIEIAYGTIERDEITNSIDYSATDISDDKDTSIKTSRRKLSYKVCFEFAKQVMVKRAMRCIVSVMIFSITTLLVLILCEMLFRDDSIAIANYVNKNDMQILQLYSSTTTEYSNLSIDDRITSGKHFYELLTDCADKNKIIKYGEYCEIQAGDLYIDDSSKIYISGEAAKYCTFKGDFPELNNEVAVSTTFANKLLNGDNPIGLSILIDDKEYVITAVVSQMCGKKTEEITIDMGYGEEPLGNIVFFPYNSDWQYSSEEYVYMPGFGVTSKRNLFSQVTIYHNVCSAKENTNILAGRMPQKNNEVLISYSICELFEKSAEDIIGASYTLTDLNNKQYENAFWNVINLYDYIGESFTIVGITEDDGDFFVLPSVYEKLQKEYQTYHNGSYMLLVDDKTIEEDLFALYNNDVKINSDSLDKFYELAYNVDAISVILIIGVGIISLLSVLQMISLYSYSINDNKKTIGILRTLGINKSDTQKIFTVECLVITAISFLIAMVVSAVVTYAINQFLLENILMNTGINFLHIRSIVVIIALAITMLLSVLSVIIPLRKYSKTKIIQLIK